MDKSETKGAAGTSASNTPAAATARHGGRTGLGPLLRTKRMSLARYLLIKAVSRISRDSPAYFQLIDDPLMAGYFATGAHEPGHVDLLTRCAGHGYADFLLDIGAHIGMVTVQAGGSFSEIHCLEPNPVLSHVLRANCTLAGLQPQVYDFGLSANDGTAVLRIPKKSWAGAFVAGETAYDSETLARKERFAAYDPDNYHDRPTQMRKASSFFESFFSARTASKGVVKIDIEGLERTVLDALAPFAQQGNLIILFENWQRSFDVAGYFRQCFPALAVFRFESNLDGKGRLARVATQLLQGQREGLSADIAGRSVGDFAAMPKGVAQGLGLAA